jgi:cell division protein FtsQ
MPIVQSRWLKGGVLLSALAVVMVWFQQRVDIDQLLPIERVQIEGEFKHLSTQDLQEQALPHVSGGFFTVNLVDVRNALIILPWVEDLSIRRTWPDALTIRVIEKQAVAYWGETQLISSRAEIFEPNGLSRDMVLPVLMGPQGQHEVMLKELARMQAWLMDSGLMISKILQDERRSWVLYMETGLELRLGRHSRSERLHRFVDVYTQHLKKKNEHIKHIDMRYTNGFAVAWKQEQQGRGA